MVQPATLQETPKSSAARLPMILFLKKNGQLHLQTLFPVIFLSGTGWSSSCASKISIGEPLEDCFTPSWQNLDQVVIVSTCVDSFSKRLNLLINKKGGLIEHLLYFIHALCCSCIFNKGLLLLVILLWFAY